MCEHLEAVSAGQIHRLMINIPPRHTKSLTVAVFWPVWDWLKTPERQFLFCSYIEKLSIRDCVKSRRVFQSPMFQDMLYYSQPDLVLTSDQNTKTKYENSKNGYRMATAVDGGNTGEGGDFIGIDDPHNIKEGESEAKRTGVTKWWDEVMPTRLNDAKTGAFVAVMQRTHHKDFCGHVLAREGNEWTQLIIPAEYEKTTRITCLGWQDPRRKEGTPICKARFDKEDLRKLKRSLGTYATAGQLQQRPSPRGGGIFKVGMISIVPVFTRNHVKRAVRYWDKAGTDGAGCRTAGVLILELSKGPIQFLVANVVKGQWSYGERENRILQVAKTDAIDFGGRKDFVEIWTEQEGGSGGKESAERTVKLLKGYNIHKEPVRGDKKTRAQPLSAQVEIGNVACLEGPWVTEYIEELEVFDTGTFKDQVDGSSGAFNKICDLGDGVTEAGVWGRD